MSSTFLLQLTYAVIYYPTLEEVPWLHGLKNTKKLPTIFKKLKKKCKISYKYACLCFEYQNKAHKMAIKADVFSQNVIDFSNFCQLLQTSILYRSTQNSQHNENREDCKNFVFNAPKNDVLSLIYDPGLLSVTKGL